MVNKGCQWLELNPGRLVSEAAALPTVPPSNFCCRVTHCRFIRTHQTIKSFIVRTNRSTLHTDLCSTYNSLTGRKSQSVYNMFTPRPWKEVNNGVQMTYLVLYL